MRTGPLFFNVSLAIAFLAVVVVGVLLLGMSGWSNGEGSPAASPAAPGAEIRTVRGTSLEPLLPDGSEVAIAPAEGEAIARNDLVTLHIGFAENPIIKIVKGLPGDRLALEPTAPGSFQIFVNGAPARNSEDVPYAVDQRGYRMLSLYVEDYGGVIPPDAYLLLGDNPSGTRDSTRFGLVHRRDIVGKVTGVTAP